MSGQPGCPQERDVLDLVAIGQWPGRADHELAAHVATCSNCTDLAALAAGLTAWADDVMADVRVPDAAVVWYRAEARSRQERASQAARPVTLLVLVTVAVIAATILFGWMLVAPSTGELWQTLLAWWWRPALSGASALEWQLPSWWRWLAVALGAWAAALPVAFYLARAADHETQRSDV